MGLFSSSHPSRVRGLKYKFLKNVLMDFTVAPFTGAWIEIGKGRRNGIGRPRRTLHGCVD